MISYIIQLLEMEKKKIAVLISSGGLKGYGTRDRKHLQDSCLKIFWLNQIFFQVVFRHYFNTLKLCPISYYLKWIDYYLFADFNILFYIEMVPYWTNVKHVKYFLQIRSVCFFCKNVLEMFWFLRKTTWK